MSNSIAPGSSADVNVKVTALTTNPNVPVTYKTIILKRNLVNGVNTLTQEMMSVTNTKYVIKYDYVLDENITVPENCILEFDGGSISGNYSLTGQNTKIINSSNSYIFKLTSIVGINIEKLPLSWCGGVADYNENNNTGTDNSSALLHAITLASANGNIPVYIDGNYFCATKIDISVPLSLCGNYTAKEGKPTGSGYGSRIIVATNITLFNIVGFNTYWYQINFEKVAFKGSNKTSTLLYTEASNGPARPHKIESCEFIDFYRCLEIIVPKGSETNLFNITIFNCNIINNFEVIYSNGTSAIGNIHIFDNIIEHNGINANNNITSNGVLYLSLFGSCIIENNLFEGQPNVINVTDLRIGSLSIINNYFEANDSGDYIINIRKTTNYSANINIYGNNLIQTGNTIIINAKYCNINIPKDCIERRILKLSGGTVLPDYDNIKVTQLDVDNSNFALPKIQSFIGVNNNCIMPTSYLGDLPSYDRNVKKIGIDCFKCIYSSPTFYVTYSNLNIAAGSYIYLIFYCDRYDNNSSNPMSIYINDEYVTEFGVDSFRLWKYKATTTITKIQIKSNQGSVLSPIGLYVDFTGNINDLKIPTKEDFFATYFKKCGVTEDRPPINSDYASIYAGWEYFDETIGKPIWYNSGWKDATGATV